MDKLIRRLISLVCAVIITVCLICYASFAEGDGDKNQEVPGVETTETPEGTEGEETPEEEIPTEETEKPETEPVGIPETDVKAVETPEEETDETPVEDPPADQAPAEETPVDKTPVEETPADKTPVEEASAEGSGMKETEKAESPKTVTEEAAPEGAVTKKTPEEAGNDVLNTEKPAGESPVLSGDDLISEEDIPDNSVLIGQILDEMDESRSIDVYISFDGEYVTYDDTVTLYAVLKGYENCTFTIQWQQSRDGKEWTDIPDETGLQYKFLVTKDNYNLFWRLSVHIVSIEIPDEMLEQEAGQE